MTYQSDGRKIRRDMTVGELRELLAEYADHTPVAPLVNRTIGVLLVAELHEIDFAPVLLIGEPIDLRVPATVPEWIEEKS